jgi:2-dehydro-3-deoxyphosphogluconate aldolase/(4S)-4-hydroxy-2-oxoglutarate aldolase
MARFSRIEVVNKMKETGIVPVFYHPEMEVCKNVVKACYEGGIRVFEFTNRGDFAHMIFGELNKFTAENYPEMIMGIGSVIDGATASLYLQLGANFIVSPIVDEEMARICNKRKVSWSPGCGSVTEIVKAHELGSEVVKIFPGSQVGGPGFVKAVRGPFPWASIMPTGGVKPDRENLEGWFEAGVHCVGMGSQLFTKDLIRPENQNDLRAKIKSTLELIQTIRQGE